MSSSLSHPAWCTCSLGQDLRSLPRIVTWFSGPMNNRNGSIFCDYIYNTNHGTNSRPLIYRHQKNQIPLA
jgi:hypothetical protein